MPSSPPSSSSTNWFRTVSSSPVPPYQLRALVLEYLSHNCYSKTAKCFARDSTVRHLNADGDEVKVDGGEQQQTLSKELSEELLKLIQLRQQIRGLLLNGQIEDATEMLNEHFPTVLSQSQSGDPRRSSWLPHILNNLTYAPSTSVDPAHQVLNLRIQAFIESCRTVPLDFPPQASSPLSSGSDEQAGEATPRADATRLGLQDDSRSLVKKLELISKAKKLRGLASALPDAQDREVYNKELEHVSILLAYKDPEKSSAAKYLSQERRVAVANQIDCAILNRAGFPPISSLELLVRYVTVLWTAAHRAGVKPRPGAILPPAVQKDSEVVPAFDLHQFMNTTS